MDSGRANLRVLMLPWLAHGHISPYFELAKRLGKRNFHIYFCSTPINLSSIKNKIPDEYSHAVELVELELPSLPGLPPQYHTTNGLPPHLMPTLKIAFEMVSPQFSKILEKYSPDLVINDFNQPWAATTSSSYNIPVVQFQIMGATFCSLVLHYLTGASGRFPFQEIYLREYERTRMKNSSASSTNDLKENVSFPDMFRRSSKIVLIKTFRELEGKYIDYLSLLVGQKILPLGPLLQDSIYEDNDGMDIIQWLDKKDLFSTVFVSFGSEYYLSKQELEELAQGLELSNVNFIWVVRFPLGENIELEKALPEGFLDRVGERGMVVKGWAPQAKILGHSSIGGFVSHCGWSSVMESLRFGVPIIAMPMHIDQPLNSRLLEEIGAAVEIVRDNNGNLERQEVAKVIGRVVVEKSGEVVKKKATELGEIISKKKDEEIDVVVEELLQLCQKQN